MTRVSAAAAAVHHHHQTGLGLKAAWVGAEVFGDLMAKGKQQQEQQQEANSSATAVAAAGVKSVDQVLESIRADYAEDYFISGKGEMADYDAEVRLCVCVCVSQG